MGKTSTTVKNRWNVKSYDRLAINVPKGRKNDIEAHAQSKGLSVNGLVGELLRADLNMTEEEWKRKPDEEYLAPCGTKIKPTPLDGEPGRCYNQGIAEGFYRLLALLIGTIMTAIMVVHFLLQVIQRFTHHISDDANAGYHKQKVRHGFHLLPVRFRGGMVSSPPLRHGRVFRHGRLNHIRRLASRKNRLPLTESRENARM